MKKTDRARFDFLLGNSIPSKQSTTLKRIWGQLAPRIGQLMIEVNEELKRHKFVRESHGTISARFSSTLGSAVDLAIGQHYGSHSPFSPKRGMISLLGDMERYALREMYSRLQLPGIGRKFINQPWRYRIMARFLLVIARLRGDQFSANRMNWDSLSDWYSLKGLCPRCQPLNKCDARLRTLVPDVVVDEFISTIGKLRRCIPLNARNAIYQPAFDGCGMLQAGTGDLFIQDTLYEIKSSIVDRLQAKDLHQLLSYCVLNALRYHEQQLPIHRIALINPRRAFRYRITLSSLSERIGCGTFSNLVQEFRRALKTDLPDYLRKSIFKSLSPFYQSRVREKLRAMGLPSNIASAVIC